MVQNGRVYQKKKKDNSYCPYCIIYRVKWLWYFGITIETT